MTKICNCCLRSFDLPRPDWIHDLALPPKCKQVLTLLAANIGQVIAANTIADFVYKDSPDGGPLTADACIRVYVTKARNAAITTGHDIKTYSGEGYRLVKVEVAT